MDDAHKLYVDPEMIAAVQASERDARDHLAESLASAERAAALAPSESEIADEDGED